MKKNTQTLLPQNREELATLIFAMEVNEWGLDVGKHREGAEFYHELAATSIDVADIFYDELERKNNVDKGTQQTNRGTL